MKALVQMNRHIKLQTLISILFISVGGIAAAEAKHGIAMYGEPVLPQDFVSLPLC